MSELVPRIILSALFLSLACVSVAQDKRALVIGIGEYPQASGWSKINGDQDIEIITIFLLDNGFAQNKIVALKNDQATKANIIQQFKSLTSLAKTGDHIYIHFSGHGQQITDTNGDEDDGYDESWVPYDARKSFIKGQYEGVNHLIDDQINDLLWNIQKNIGPSGRLIITVDACHSGDSSRGDEDIDADLIVRGTMDRFYIPIEQPVKRVTKQPIQWVMISACKAYQNNYECKIGNKRYGSLSYALYLRRNEIDGKQIDAVSDMISETLLGLVTRPQSIQVDSHTDFSEAILFCK